MIWFTADPHFNHTNILKYCPESRNYKNCRKMNNAIIRNYNSVVQPNDTVYILGDLGFGPKELVIELMKKLHGDKFLVIGNHDNFTDEQYHEMGFLEWGPGFFLSGYGGNRPVIMAHDPIQSLMTYRMYRFDRGVVPIILNGHLHDSEEYSRDMKTGAISINVGVDVWDMTPVNMTQILERERRIKEELCLGG